MRRLGRLLLLPAFCLFHLQDVLQGLFQLGRFFLGEGGQDDQHVLLLVQGGEGSSERVADDIDLPVTVCLGVEQGVVGQTLDLFCRHELFQPGGSLRIQVLQE